MKRIVAFSSVSFVAIVVAATAIPTYGASGTPIASSPTVVPAAMKAQFGVFRRSASSNDSLTNVISPDGDFVQSQGLARSLARRVTASPSFRSKVWIAPAVTGACILVEEPAATGPGGMCGPQIIDDPYHGGVYTSKNLDGSVDVVGVVPDTAESVRLVLADGTSMNVSIADNAYAVNLPDYPSSINIVDSKLGDVTIDVPRPHGV